MITALSNNFGAGEIQLMDFQKDGLVVLNGAFEFDPANAAYLAAQVLEIKVPRLMINKSTNAVVYLVDIENQMPHATLLKAWVKDCNTICIEPCRCFDSSARLQIIFCSGFVVKGQRSDMVLDEVVRPTVEAESGNFKLDSFGYYQQLIIKDNRWGFMTLLFEKFQAPNIGEEFSFTIPQLPDSMDCYAVLAIPENSQEVGSPVCVCHIVGQRVNCTPVQDVYNSANEGRFLTGWFVLDDITE